MFRRKTDQVYSTLQQVQRRITEQTGNVPDLAVEPKPRPAIEAPPPLRPLEAALRARPGAQPVVEPAAQHLDPAATTPGRRYALQVSLDLLLMLMVMWLATVAAAYSIGRYQAGHGAANPGADFADGPAGEREPAAADPGAAAPVHVGTDYLLLQSAADTTDNQNRFAKQADDFNRAAQSEKNTRLGIKPWFAVHRVANGGLQLVYGMIDGRLGIDRRHYDSVADLFGNIPDAKDPTKKAYPELKWVKPPTGK